MEDARSRLENALTTVEQRKAEITLARAALRSSASELERLHEDFQFDGATPHAAGRLVATQA